MNYKAILKQAIDLHVHIGPEIVPRKFDLQKLVKTEKGKLKGMAIKNHFFPTVAMGNSKKSPFIIHSVTLSNYLGGFNSDIILASAQLSKKPIIVWFPTIHAENILKDGKYEIPLEWIPKDKRKKFKTRLAKEIPGLSILNKKGQIKEEIRGVLRTIKQTKTILATGHISWQEAEKLVKTAIKDYKINRVIITHPIYQQIAMPIIVQKELANMGAYIEHCSTMDTIDKIPIKKIASQINKISPKNCIISSDVGQTFSKNPSQALKDFCLKLEKKGISRAEIKKMLVDNPKKIIFYNNS